MNAVVTTTQSRALTAALADHLHPHPDVGPQAVTAGVRREAAALLPAAERALAPATAEQWRHWLRPFAVLPRAPADGPAFALVLSAIMFACEAPALALSEVTQRDGLRTWRFWPAPAEVSVLLAPAINALRARRESLARLTARPEIEAPRVRLSDAERASLAAQMRGLAASIAGGAASPAASARALHVSPGQLLTQYEAIAAEAGPGAQLARLRVAALRRQIGEAA